MPPASRRRTVVRVLGAAFAGLAVAGAFPPYDIVWLMPLGLAGLIVAVREASGGVGFLVGLSFGLGLMLPLLRWLTIIGVDAWVALGLLEALFYGVLGLAWAWLLGRRLDGRRLGGRTWWPLGVALTWVGAEMARSLVPFGGLPWGRLAFGLIDTSLVRYGRLGGPALVSFVVVLAVAAVVDLVEVRRPARATLLRAAGVAALLLASLVLPVGAAHPVQTVQVAAVQGNVPGEGMDPFAERREVLHNHADATRRFARQVAAGDRPGPDLVIWPENSTDIDPFVDDSAYDEIDRAVRAVGVPTLVGAVVNGPDATHVQNMGIVWDPAEGPGEEYVKRHPVPFGEYIPFRGLLTSFIDRLSQIPRDFAQGSTVGALDVGPVRLGDVICFEVAYDGLIRDVVDHGAQLLVVQTNNATYTGTGQLEQQFAISRYRAVETGRSLIVAATNGISGIVAPDGAVVASTSQRTREILDESVVVADGMTLGVRLGFWVELVLAMLGLAATVLAYLDRRRYMGRMET